MQNKTKLYVLFVQIKPIDAEQNQAVRPVCSNQTNWYKRDDIKSIKTPENEAYLCTTIEVIPCFNCAQQKKVIQ